MMEGHEEKAAEAEYELAEMEEQSDSLADDIEGTRDEWARKKQDDSVPGAGVGEHDEGPDPEVTGGGPGGGGSPELDD
jgi:hypothetical protein